MELDRGHVNGRLGVMSGRICKVLACMVLRGCTDSEQMEKKKLGCNQLTRVYLESRDGH